MAVHLHCPHAIEDGGKGESGFVQMSLQGSLVQPKRMCTSTHRGAPRWQKDEDCFLDFVGERLFSGVHDSIEEMLGMKRESGIGLRIATIEIRGLDDKAVQFRSEFNRALKDMPVNRHFRGRRRVVSEAHLFRLPVWTGNGAANASHHAKREVCGLTRGSGRRQRELFTEYADFASVLDLEDQRRIDPVPVLRKDVESIAERALVCNQKADSAHIRKRTPFRHSESQRHAAGFKRGAFKQVNGDGSRDHRLGVHKHRAGKPGLTQQRNRVGAKRADDLNKSSKRCCPNQFQ